MQKLPESELDVMLALWEVGQPTSRAWIEEQLSHRDWSVTTINSFLSRLVDKGFVSCEKLGKTNYYTSLVPKEQYLQFEGDTILNRLFQGSVKNFMLSISSTEALGADEIQELQHYLEELKGGRDDD